MKKACAKTRNDKKNHKKTHSNVQKPTKKKIKLKTEQHEPQPKSEVIVSNMGG